MFTDKQKSFIAQNFCLKIVNIINLTFDISSTEVFLIVQIIYLTLGHQIMKSIEDQAYLWVQ